MSKDWTRWSGRRSRQWHQSVVPRRIPARKPAMSFVPIAVAEETSRPHAGLIEIAINDVVIRVLEPVDPRALAIVLAAVRGTS